MLEIGGDSDFLEKPFRAEHGSELGVENLYGNLTVMLVVVGEVNGRHSTAAELALD
jgi:hypothetical protein